LETLGNGAFPVPWLDAPVGLRVGIEPPLVVITTNGERELPAAFLRRCLVLHLELPKERDDLVAWLVKRGGEHFGVDCAESVRILVAEKLVEDRGRASERGPHKPGQAEYLDILRALVRARGSDETAQTDLFKRIARFAFEKTGTAGT